MKSSIHLVWGLLYGVANLFIFRKLRVQVKLSNPLAVQQSQKLQLLSAATHQLQAADLF